MIQAVYVLPAKCAGYMGLVWAERNNSHTGNTLPIIRQLWVIFLQLGSFIGVLSVFLFIVYQTITITLRNLIQHVIIL